MAEQFLVYLSSTVEDLKDERDRAIQVIGQIGTVKTSYRASDYGVVETCVSDVRKCDLYVAIIGKRYGYVPDGEDDPTHKSITELEYEACDREDGSHIPRLIFLKSGAAGIEDKFNDSETHLATADRMRNFRQRVNGSSEVAFEFRNLHEFAAELKVRLAEKEQQFAARHAAKQRAAAIAHVTPGGLFDEPIRKNALTPAAIAVTAGTDRAFSDRLRTFRTPRFGAFELSPDADDFVPAGDAGFAKGQLGALLLTPESLTRLVTTVNTDRVATLIDMQVAARGRFVLLCAGVEPAQLPAAWNAAEPLPIGRSAEDLGARSLFDKLSRLEPSLTAEQRLALPYLILAPSRGEVEALCDPAAAAFDGFKGAHRDVRRSQFEAVRKAAQALPAWPASAYGHGAEDWHCFSSGATAKAIVLRSIHRLNRSQGNAWGQRLLTGTQLVARRYRVADALYDRQGSRAAVEAACDEGALLVVDELALLMPALRAVAERLVRSGRGAVVSVSACDPAHGPSSDLLDEFSFLGVGTLIHRYRVEHDPRCEIALNSAERFERWLQHAIPELVASRTGLLASQANRAQELLA